MSKSFRNFKSHSNHELAHAAKKIFSDELKLMLKNIA
jgi:hypothetical protein